ncbi:MAG: sigma-54 dependent transcriptional regulator [Usitatibacteraceae bacterium]
MARAAERRANGKVLVIEDDAAARFGIATALRSRGYTVDEAETCADALRLFASKPDVVLADLRLPDGDAVTIIPRLRAIDSSVPVYVMTGFATVDIAVRAVKEGAEEFFTKPVEMQNLFRCVETAVARRRSMRSGKHARVGDESIGARSDAMQQLDEELERLRNSDCTVLILGETGTGKTVLARRIHELGARGRGPFIDINCAGLSRDFVESELFGHERGAFTGAHAPKQGLLDAANGGTVFLDEIGDIDVQVQPKILKVLEERRFRRMGDVRERSADVRLVAATHLDLLAAIAAKTFRADLFYRISTVTLHVPALRERHADIVPLAQQVLREAGAPDVELAPGAWDKITGYAWPGNIRELKNVLQRALLLKRGAIVTAEEIRFDTEQRSSGTMPAVRSPPSKPQPLPSLVPPSTLEEMERIHIERALAVEREQHILFAARYLSSRTKRHPTGERAAAEMQIGAVEAHRDDLIVMGARRSHRPCARKRAAVSGEATGNLNASRQHRLQARHQCAAIDGHACAEHHHRREPCGRQRACQAASRRKRIGHRCNSRGLDADKRAIEFNRGQTGGLIVHTAAVHLSRCRTSNEICAWESSTQRIM